MPGKPTTHGAHGAPRTTSIAPAGDARRVRRAATLPYLAARTPNDMHSRDVAHVDVAVPAEYVTWVTQRRGAERVADGVATAFVVYVARVSADTSFELGAVSLDAADGAAPAPPRVVPCGIDLEMERGFDHALGHVAAQLDRARDASRRAIPHACTRLAHGSSAAADREGALPLALAFAEDANPNAALPPSALLALVVGRDARACRLLYRRDVLADGDAARIGGHLTTLLASVAVPGGARRPLHALPLLTAAERRRMLVEWNDTVVDYPRTATVHSLFEAQAARTPNAIAVEHRGRRITYRELDAEADRWAAHLRALGVGADRLVGLRAERSIELVVGLLAVLKAGGAYVPIDPTYPAERVAFMLDDCGAELVLTTRALGSAPLRDGVRTLCLDEPLAAPAADGARAPHAAPRATANSLAYVLYTSGSTGKPKGVLVHHRGVVNYLWWCIDAYELRAGAGSPVHSPVAFDLTVTSLLAPLLAGRTALLLDEDQGVSALATALRERSGFSLVKITPSHLDLLRLQLGPHEVAGRTRMFVVGGEALRGESLAFWQRHAPDTVIVNEYGPTETVVGCCVQRVTAADRVTGSVPIGRPIANTRLYVLDARMQPLPIGVPGELFIGGDGVARGYLHRPTLTADKFVDDPFAGAPGARLYRTGDRARYRADGTLEFLGRLDDQVKVRGYRIELGEIEAALASHPDVSEAAVVPRESAPGDVRLVAYYVPGTARAPNDEALRAWLGARLPEYMLPWALVPMAALPLTSNGKVDRKALPEPSLAPATRKRVAPRTELERLLTRVWREVLGAEVGVTDDFFEFGGHSLLAVRMMHRVGDLTGARPPLSVLHTGPTIEQLARAIERGAAHATADQPVVLLREGDPSKPGFFFFHGALGGRGFYARDVVRELDAYQPAYIVHPFDVDGPSTLEEMAAARVDAIRAAQPTGPYHLAGVCNGGALAYEVARQLRTRGERVGLLALINTGERNAGLRPLRAAVRAMSRALGWDETREVDLYLGLRQHALWHLPHLPHLDHRSGWGDRLRFVGAAAGFALRKLLGHRRVPESADARPTDSGDGAYGSPEAPSAPIDPVARRRDAFYDRVLTSYVPRRHDGPVAVVFWEHSEAADDEDGLHRDDWTRGWGRLSPRADVRFIPGENRDVNTRDAAALGRELGALLREAQGATV